MNYKILYLNNMFLYFTILSNMCVFIFYLISFILYFANKLKDNKLYYIIKGMITVDITLTMAVYNFVLTSGTLYQEHVFAGMFVHLITPTLVILDYIMFGKKGHLKYSYPIYWSISLIIYTLVCWLYGFYGGVFADGNSYPYFYMNFNEFGLLGVIKNCMIVYMIYLIYSYIIVWLDNLCAKESKLWRI